MKVTLEISLPDFLEPLIRADGGLLPQQISEEVNRRLKKDYGRIIDESMWRSIKDEIKVEVVS